MAMKTQLLEIIHNQLDLFPQQLEKIDRAAEGIAGGEVGELLLKRKLITEKQLLYAKSALYNIPFQEDLSPAEDVGDQLGEVPSRFLKQYEMVPLRLEEVGSGGQKNCVMAVNDPSRVDAFDDLARLLGAASYELVVAPREAI